jgi:hypothetical protein
MKLLIMRLPPSSCHFISPWTSTLISNTVSIRSSLKVGDQVLHPHRTMGKIIVLYILILMF